jgi:hypothetical protein
METRQNIVILAGINILDFGGLAEIESAPASTTTASV